MALITATLLFGERGVAGAGGALSKYLGFIAGSLHSLVMSCRVGGKMFNRGLNRKRLAREASKARCEGLANFL